MGSPAIRSFEKIRVFKVEAVTGQGIKEDPVRVVTAWFTEDGQLLRYDDPSDKPVT